MIWLLLAILSSTMVSVMMRLGEGHIKSNGAMFTINYLICLVLSRLFMGQMALFGDLKGMSTALGLGLISGILYLGSFVLLQQNIKRNGVVMASVFMKLGVLVPVLMAILVFRERPGILQVAGIVLALLAILEMQLEGLGKQKEEMGKKGSRLLLILLLLGGGITDSMANIYDKAGSDLYSDHYLLFTFFAALVCALIMLIGELKKEGKGLGGIGFGSLLFGVLVGIPNYFSARFLLLALGSIPAVITYPLYSVTTMLCICLAGVFCFGEKLSRAKKIAIVMVVAALILLN